MLTRPRLDAASRAKTGVSVAGPRVEHRAHPRSAPAVRISDLGAFSARAQPARGEQDARLGRDRMCVTPSPLFMRRIRRPRIDIHPADRSTHVLEVASKGNRKVPGASRSSDSKETPKWFG